MNVHWNMYIMHTLTHNKCQKKKFTLISIGAIVPVLVLQPFLKEKKKMLNKMIFFFQTTLSTNNMIQLYLCKHYSNSTSVIS